MDFAHTPRRYAQALSQRRIGTYLVLGLGSIVFAFGVRSWLDRQSVHAYTRTSTSPAAEVVLERSELREYFVPAFEFRAIESDGVPQVTFNAGWCLQTYRAARGESITPIDRIVTAAVLDAWPESWMQERVRQQLAEIEAEKAVRYDQRSLDRWVHQFVDGLLVDDEVRGRLEAKMSEAANDLGLPVRWKEETE